MNPPDAPDIERIELPDDAGCERAVMRVDVRKSLFVHQSPGGYLCRVGSSKRPIPPDRLAQLFQHRSQTRLIRFDETTVFAAALSDLDEALWRRFAPARTEETPERLLSKLAMASQDDAGAWRPTIAGVLLACREPQRYMSSAFIQAVAYRGKTISPEAFQAYRRDARDITGPLDRQIFEACDFVRKNMQMAARKSPSGGREDLPQYDMLAVFEAVANAVAHRDYAMAGSKVRLRMFDDRLEIYTPGLLANTMTPETLPFRQRARNEAITSLLARCPVEHDDFRNDRPRIMERRGEGVPIILSRSERLSGRLPEYRQIDESELLLTVHAASVS